MFLCLNLTASEYGKFSFVARLNNLFNGLDEASPLRYVVYTSIIKLASQSDLLYLVNPKLEEVKNWLVQWNVGIPKVQALLRVLYESFVQCKQR
jgi:translation initiation factor 3 subunit M